MIVMIVDIHLKSHVQLANIAKALDLVCLPFRSS